jgi:hypothetical protein
VPVADGRGESREVLAAALDLDVVLAVALKCGGKIRIGLCSMSTS